MGGVQTYTVFGRQIGSHYLAIGVLGGLAAIPVVRSFGSSGKKAAATPPINASSPDEADFIKKFLESADAGAPEKEAKEAAHH